MSTTPGQDPTNTPGQDPTNPGQDPTKTGGQVPTVEELQAEITRLRADNKELRSENAQRRVEAKDLRDEVEKAKTAGTGDMSKVDAKVTALEQGLQVANERAVNAEIKAAAAKAGFKNPDAAVKLLDRSKLLIDGSDVKNASDVLAELAKSDPYLVGADPAGSGDAGAGNPSGNPQDFSSLVRQAFGG